MEVLDSHPDPEHWKRELKKKKTKINLQAWNIIIILKQMYHIHYNFVQDNYEFYFVRKFETTEVVFCFF